MMPEQLSPFTVSAVVDITSGALITRPYVQPGHVDYTAHATALAQTTPLPPTHQFRWVQVRARNPAHAASTDRLTADLGPEPGRRPPVARTVTGPPGLKPYTVSARVDWRTRRPVGEAVVLDGHQRPRIAGAWWTRQHTAHVWATNQTAAFMYAFGTGPAAGRTAAGTPRARGPALDTRQFGSTFEVIAEVHEPGPHEPVATAASPPMQPSKAPSTGTGPNQPAATPPAFNSVRTPVAQDAAYAIAERQWHRLADRPAAERLTAVTDAIWAHSYPQVYRAAYTYAASTIAAEATTAARANPAASLPLHHLAATAGAAISQIVPNRPSAPAADQATLDAVVQAVAATQDPRPPWQRVADAMLDNIKHAALRHGAAAATADTYSGWCNRHGDALANRIAINGQPATTWVNNLMATVSGNASGPPSRRVYAGAHDGTGRTAAQLARQDQAPGAPTAQQPAPRTRPRRPEQPPPPTTEARHGR